MTSLRRLSVLIGTLALLWAGTGLPLPSAQAMDMWCWDDPTVAINGHQVSINVGVQDSPSRVTSHIKRATIVVTVPQGVPTSVISTQRGPFPVTVRFVRSGTWQPGTPFTVTMSTWFTATVREPAALQVTYPTGKTAVFSGTTVVIFAGPFSLT